MWGKNLRRFEKRRKRPKTGASVKRSPICPCGVPNISRNLAPESGQCQSSVKRDGGQLGSPACRPVKSRLTVRAACPLARVVNVAWVFGRRWRFVPGRATKVAAVSEIRLTPAGHLCWESPELQTEPAQLKALREVFSVDWREGLFTLAAEKTPVGDSLTQRYWQGVADQ